MAFSERSLDDYVDVAQRIADFRALYPSGSLQPADPAMPYHVVRVPAGWCQQCIGRRQIKTGQNWKTCPRCQGTGLRGEGEPAEDVFIVYSAAAYRTPDDPRPGVGMAWEPFPGRTPYTAASELMNAETSAWGRAIIAVLVSDSKQGVASRQEVAARRAEREDGLPTNRDGSLSRAQTTDAEKDAAGVMTSAQLAEHTALGGGNPKTPKAERERVTRLQHPEICACGHPYAKHLTNPEGCSLCPCPVPPSNQDIWTDQPPAPVLEGVEDQAGTISPQQQRAMHAAFTQAGIKDRAARLTATTSIVGRPVTSSNELSYLEAGRVLEALHEKVRTP